METSVNWTKISGRGLNECWIWLGGMRFGAPHGWDPVQKKYRKVARMVWESVKGPPNGQVVRKCSNPRCVNPDHCVLTHQGPHGSLHGMSKLTEKQVLEIRERYANEDIYQRELAVQYGVTQQLVSFIVNFKGWGHVTGHPG